MRDDDDVPRMERELAEAQVTIQRLRTENTALKQRLGETRGAAPEAHPPAPADPSPQGSAYRTVDRRLQVEQALADAAAEVARLRIENAILQARASKKKPRWSGFAFFVPAATLSLLGVLWFVTNDGCLLLLGAILGLGFSVWYLIEGIPGRDGGAPPGPPMIPPR
jgi:hypothetical protein